MRNISAMAQGVKVQTFFEGSFLWRDESLEGRGHSMRLFLICRSEERRVGEECRARGWEKQVSKKGRPKNGIELDKSRKLKQSREGKRG